MPFLSHQPLHVTGSADDTPVSVEFESGSAGDCIERKDVPICRRTLGIDERGSDLGVIDRIKLALLRRFGYDKAPSRALNYLWTTRRAPGTIIESPYTDQIMMMPVRSGSTRVGEWVSERRNVRADYREAYGEAPPPVNGIAIMTDTDNTGGTATALYGDIVFRKRERSGAPSE